MSKKRKAQEDLSDERPLKLPCIREDYEYDLRRGKELYDAKLYKEALSYLTKVVALDANNVEALTLLASCYESMCNKSVALNLYKRAADSGGCKDSYYALAKYLYDGTSCEKDISSAIKYSTLAAQLGNYKGAYNLGSYYLQISDIKQALYWYELGAQNEHFECLKELGELYYHGKEVAKDEEKGLQYWHKAELVGEESEDGYSELLNSIGSCYRFAKGTKQDLSKAATYYLRSMEYTGITDDSYRIAIDLYNNRHFKEAVMLLHRITKDDMYCERYRYAAYCMAQCYYFGYGISKNYHRAYDYYKAFYRSYSVMPAEELALYYLQMGSSYLFARGVFKDDITAIELYAKAAYYGSKDAMILLTNWPQCTITITNTPLSVILLEIEKYL